jgi:hypothetical protein
MGLSHMNIDILHALHKPDPVRVSVFAHDAELRQWLLDELALLSPPFEVRALETLEHAGNDLLIVGLDCMRTHDIEQLRAVILRRITVIAIGSPQVLHDPLDFAFVLDPELTSHQLKRALRDSTALH